MGKVLDPIVVNPKKEQAVKPFERKDIEKFAYDVLADLGDEVINKAIEDGKIVLPENIDVSKLPVLSEQVEENSIPKEKWLSLAGKVFVSQGRVCYPIDCYDAELYDYLYLLGITDEGVLTFVNIYMEGMSDEYASVEEYTYYLPSEPVSPGTKLYKHTVANGPASIVYISLSNVSKKIIENTIAVVYVSGSGGAFSFAGVSNLDLIQTTLYPPTVPSPTTAIYVVGLDSSGQYVSIDVTTWWNNATDTVTEL